MEKNYYEWLEVDRKASDFVIEKTYKLLAKKYHPDLQDGNTKIEYEEIMKHINEAYDTLSDPDKRKEYDAELAENDINEEAFYELQNENQKLRNILHELNSQIQAGRINNSNYQIINQKINEAVSQAYHDAYVQDLKARGFKIKEKKTWKDYLRFLIAFSITLTLLFLFFQLPFVKDYINDLFNNNSILESFIKMF